MDSDGSSPRTNLRRSTRRSRTTSENNSNNSPKPVTEQTSVDSSIDDQTKSLLQTLGEENDPQNMDLADICGTVKRFQNFIINNPLFVYRKRNF